MHEATQNTTARRRRRAPLVVALVACVCVAAAWGVRTEPVMRPLVEARVAEAATALGATITIGSMGPSGLSGVVLRDILVSPIEGGPVLAQVAEVRLRPRLSAVWRGELEVASVDVIGAAVDVALDSSGAGHAPWLRSRLAGNDTVHEGQAPAGRRWRDAPTVHVSASEVRVTDPSGQYPSMSTRVESVTLVGVAGAPGTPDRADIEGHVDVDGLGRTLLIGTLGGAEGLGLTLRTLHDNDLFTVLPSAWSPSAEATFSLGALSTAWPPAISARPVSLQRLNMPLWGIDTWRLDSVWSDEVRVALDGDGLKVAVRNVRAGLSGLIAETELNVRNAAWSRAWDGSTQRLDVEIVDDNGDVARLAWSQTPDGFDRFQAHAQSFDGGNIVPLLPETVPARLHGGVFDVDVDVTRASDGTWAGDVSVDATELTAYSAAVSLAPVVGVDVGFDVSFYAAPAESTLAVQSATLRLGDARVRWDGRIEATADGVAARVHAELPPTAAQALLDALPRGMAPIIEDFALDGDASVRLRLEVDTRDVDTASMDIDIDSDDVVVMRFGAQAPIPWLNSDDFEWDVRTFEGGVRRIGPGSPDWVRLDEMSEYLFRAVLAAEDDRFFMHAGFDERGILRALHANLAAGRVVRGGSTISQQVVKNFFLTHERTLARKVQEAFLTWLLEQNVPKRRILEVYVNIVHWGPGIYGVGEASMAYFRHVPRRLTLRESAFLASILPNPALFGEQYSRRIVAPSRREKMRNILVNMRAQGVIDAENMAYHARLIDRGEVSMTPPPAQLGTYRRPSSERASRDEQHGALMLQR